MIYVEPEVYIRVASFDVGLKNTSMCIIDFHGMDFIIKKWDHIAISGKNISECTSDFISKLRVYQYGCIDYVLVEQQINRNTLMKCLSHVIQSFFICEVKIPSDRIIFVSPKRRLETTNPIHSRIVEETKNELGMSGTLSRKDYKRISIEITKRYLSQIQVPFWLSFFQNLPKQDDYADSFVQAVAWNATSSVFDVD